MHHITQYIAEARRQRRVLGPEEFSRKILVFSRAAEVEAALDWVQATTGTPAAAVSTYSDEKVASCPVPVIDTRRIRHSPHLLCVAYGTNPRGLCVQLARRGVFDVALHADPRFRNSKFAPDYLERHKTELQEVFSLLEDEESRLVYASVVKHRITGDHSYLRMARYAEYAHPKVLAEPGDTIVDGGASNGKTSFRFAHRVGPKGKVYAIEPDPANVRKINASLPRHKNVVLVNAALADEIGTLSFQADGNGSSRIQEGGNISVPVETVDNLALDHCDLIGLDVEGAEAATLRGAAATIRRFRPKLQISLYHQREDLFALPLMINEMASDYAFFVGHHDAYHSETDLYAVPRERLNKRAPTRSRKLADLFLGLRTR